MREKKTKKQAAGKPQQHIFASSLECPTETVHRTNARWRETPRLVNAAPQNRLEICSTKHQSSGKYSQQQNNNNRNKHPVWPNTQTFETKGCTTGGIRRWPERVRRFNGCLMSCCNAVNHPLSGNVYFPCVFVCLVWITLLLYVKTGIIFIIFIWQNWWKGSKLLQQKKNEFK